MFIRLDHGVDGEHYEEVIALYTGTSSQRHLIMWRDAAACSSSLSSAQSPRHSKAWARERKQSVYVASLVGGSLRSKTT
jgi:hypothetical protein